MIMIKFRLLDDNFQLKEELTFNSYNEARNFILKNRRELLTKEYVIVKLSSEKSFTLHSAEGRNYFYI